MKVLQILLVTLLAGTSWCTCFAQNVDQVLMAIQERRLALVQRETVETDLLRHSETLYDPEEEPSTEADPVEESELIDWGFGLSRFPTASEVVALTMSQLLQVLNRATVELDSMKPHYLNLGQKQFMSLDGEQTMKWLPSTGHVMEHNWRAKLVQLASDVEQLTALKWPMEYVRGEADVFMGEPPAIPFPQGEDEDDPWASQWGMDDYSGPGCGYDVDIYGWWAVTDGEGTSADFCSFNGLRGLKSHVAPEDESESRVVQGGELVFYRNLDTTGNLANWAWTELYPENKTTVPFNCWVKWASATNTFKHGDVSSELTYFFTAAEVRAFEAATRSLWGLPAFEIHGEFYPAEFGAEEFVYEGSDPGWSDDAYFSVKLSCVCFPAFTPMAGSDVRKFVAGENGKAGTVDAIRDDDFWRIHLGRGVQDFRQTAELSGRLDGFGNLQFIGSGSAFRIMYQTDLELYPDPLADDPYRFLPDLADPEETEFNEQRWLETGFYYKESYIRRWEEPRLRQIYGADVVVDIVHEHDYRKVLNFYWAKDVPVPAAGITAPQVIAATPFKTVVIENATVDGEPAFPTSPRKLHIDDAGLHWEIEQVVGTSGSVTGYVTKAGTSKGASDVLTCAENYTAAGTEETTTYLGETRAVTTKFFYASYPCLTTPLKSKITQGSRQVDIVFETLPPIITFGGEEVVPRGVLKNITYTGTGWDMDGANVTWNVDGTLVSEKRKVHGNEFDAVHSWNNRVRTTTRKLGSTPYRTETFTLGADLTEETTAVGGTSTVVKYKGGGDLAPWTLNQIRHFNGYVQTFNLTPGLEETVLQSLEGWGVTHDAGTQTLTTTNRGGGLISQVVTSLSGNVMLSSLAGSEHVPWGAPKKLKGRHNEITELTWQETGRSAGQMLTAKSPINVISGIAGYDVQGRPTGFNTGFASYTPSYADPLKVSVSGPSGSVSSTLNQFGEALDFKDTHGAGLELDLAPGGGHMKVDGRTVDLDINAVGEVTGVKSGLGQRGARVGFSVETVAGYSQQKLCRTDHARRQDNTDDFEVRTFFDDRDRVIRRETPAVNGGVLVETWAYNDVGRSVTYSPGPAASYRSVTQTITNSDNSTIVTSTRGGVNFSRSTTKYESGKVVSIEEIFDDSHGGTAAWTQVSRTATDPATGIRTAQPWDLTAATATSTMPVPAEITQWVGSSGATDDTQEVTRTKGRITRIHGRRAGADFNLSNWQYVNDRLVGVAGTVGGRNVALEFNAKGQVSRVSGPGFDKSFELTGTSGFEFKETDTAQGTVKVVKTSAVGDGVEVSGNVNEPKTASTSDLGNGETQTVLNTNLTVTKTVTGAVRSKAYAGGAMATTTNTFTSDNLPDVSTTGEESVNRDFSQYVSSNKISSYYPGAGTIEEEYYGSGLLRRVTAPLDERSFTHLRGQEASTIHGPDSIWANASSAYAQDNKGNRSGTVVAVPGSAGYSEQKALTASGLPYTVTSGGFSATYTYNNGTGELESITRGPLTTTVVRDSLGRITGYNTANSSGENFSYGSGYNARNQRTSRTSSNGVSWTGLVYDGRHQLTDAHLSTGAALDYSYDGRNNRGSGGGPVTFTNNGVDQVTGRTLGQRGYGVMGRVAPGSVVRVFHPQAGPGGEEITTDPGTGIYSAYWSASGGFGSGVIRVELLVRGTLQGAGTGGTDAVADQRVWAVLPASAESYGYDGAGRTVEDSLWHYTWNGMGRLVGMQRKAGTSAEPELTSEEMAFVYDAEGRRTQKTRTRTYGNASTKVERSKVFWTDWLPAYEELSVDGGTPSRRWFIWGQDVSGSWDGAGGIGGLLAIREEGGRTLLPVHDGLGNITAVINAANGDTVARYDYAPFGELLTESGDVNACPFRYQSKYYDAETGLGYFGFRYYSAKLGRWISRDPLGEDGGFNLYGYCGNDPVNRWDYLGWITGEQLAEINRLRISQGLPPLSFGPNSQHLVEPCIVCHGKDGRISIPGVSGNFSLWGGQFYDSGTEDHKAGNFTAGVAGAVASAPKDLANLGVDFWTVLVHHDYHAYEPYFDATGTTMWAREKVYGNVDHNSLITSSGDAFGDGLLFVAPIKVPATVSALANRLGSGVARIPWRLEFNRATLGDVYALGARWPLKIVRAPRLPSHVGATGASYNELVGHGIYVLRNPKMGNRIEYVGRGDAPSRILDHAQQGSGKEDLVGQLLWNNNLRMEQAVSLERELLQILGGPRSLRPSTPLRNEIDALSPLNPNFLKLEFSASDELLIETLKRARLLD